MASKTKKKSKPNESGVAKSPAFKSRGMKSVLATWFRGLMIGAALVVIAGSIWAWRDYQTFAGTPLSFKGNEERLKIKLGSSFNRIIKQIEAKGFTAPTKRWHWRVLAEEMNVLNTLHAGEYTVSNGMTPRDLLGKMARGEVVQYRFTIIEGIKFSELRTTLASDQNLTHTISTLSDAEVMHAIGRDGQHPEGRFLPETYSYPSEFTDVQLLKLAADAMDKAMNEVWLLRPADSPLQAPEEMLILASIVEKETGRASERPQIAGVFLRRMKIGMKLQTDPTVIYGIGDAYNGNITRTHLVTDTPYNTYTRFGLPPTPIAMPGRDALVATMKPADGDALFFVARGNGTHEFTSNLRDHNNAVNKFQLNR